MRIGALVSTGKDSWYSAFLASKEHKLACLVAIKSENPESYMFHVPNIDLVKLQAKAAGIPLIFRKTKGEKEKELGDLKAALREAKKKYKIQGIVSGAIFSKYQKSRIDKIAEELKLESLSPLWKKRPKTQWEEMLRAKFKIMITAVAAYGLTEEWLGKIIGQKELKQLLNLHKTCYICTGFEGGELESLTVSCPLFKKKIKILKAKKIMTGEYSGYYDIKKVELE